MPINVNANLPAVKTLSEEGIFVMTDTRATSQDIRPLKIGILNLMPTKVVTETQLLRLLGNTPLQVEVILLFTESHIPTHISTWHLESFYKSFSQIKDTKLDGLIITGAPVEMLRFEDVDYWEELTEIMRWSKANVQSTLHICWGAQAALYYHYGIDKENLGSKLFGVFPHYVIGERTQLTRGFDDVFYAPHSRHTTVSKDKILKSPKVRIISESPDAGVYIAMAKNGRQIFVTGHSEYDPLTLKYEYDRDVAKGLPIEVPKNYYPENDPTKEPIVRWRGHSHLLFSNWLNYYVYQETPYDIKQIQNIQE